MKKLFLFISAAMVAFASNAQSISVYQGDEAKLNFSPAEVDSIVFDSKAATGSISARPVNGTWCSIGTSITWYNNNVEVAGGRFTRGYQDRVMDKLAFAELINVGDSGGTAMRTMDKNLIKKADYYSVEHGINDWGNKIPVGTLDDYINKTNKGSFAYAYRQIIERIYRVNPRAKVVLCTPRKGYGFGGYLPDHWYDAIEGVYLEEYAKLVREIADYESFPVADFFYECGGQNNLDKLSIDVALHPNDDGYQMMANVLVKAFEKIISE